MSDFRHNYMVIDEGNPMIVDGEVFYRINKFGTLKQAYSSAVKSGLTGKEIVKIVKDVEVLEWKR